MNRNRNKGNNYISPRCAELDYELNLKNFNNLDFFIFCMHDVKFCDVCKNEYIACVCM